MKKEGGVSMSSVDSRVEGFLLAANNNIERMGDCIKFAHYSMKLLRSAILDTYLSQNIPEYFEISQAMVSYLICRTQDCIQIAELYRDAAYCCVEGLRLRKETHELRVVTPDPMVVVPSFGTTSPPGLFFLKSSSSTSHGGLPLYVFTP